MTLGHNTLPQEDFRLMDIVGGGRSVSVLHPSQPIVAYAVGCVVIVYDLYNDSKTYLNGHQYEIKAIAFSTSEESLYTLDNDPTGSKLIIWDWQQGTSRSQVELPIAGIQIDHFKICFDKTGSLMMILESSNLEIGGGYQVSLWNCMKNEVEIVSTMNLELQCPCLDISFLPRT